MTAKVYESTWSALLSAMLALSTLAVRAQEPAAAASAQTAPDPARLALSAVQTFYDQTKDVSADFFQTYVNKLYDRTDRSQGHVVFKKPGKMRWDKGHDPVALLLCEHLLSEQKHRVASRAT